MTEYTNPVLGRFTIEQAVAAPLDQPNTPQPALVITFLDKKQSFPLGLKDKEGQESRIDEHDVSYIMKHKLEELGTNVITTNGTLEDEKLETHTIFFPKAPSPEAIAKFADYLQKATPQQLQAEVTSGPSEYTVTNTMGENSYAIVVGADGKSHTYGPGETVPDIRTFAGSPESAETKKAAVQEAHPTELSRKEQRLEHRMEHAVERGHLGKAQHLVERFEAADEKHGGEHHDNLQQAMKQALEAISDDKAARFEVQDHNGSLEFRPSSATAASTSQHRGNGR